MVDVCPFYSRSRRGPCEVGSWPISPHEAGMIARHCLNRYEGCPRYEVLRARQEAERRAEEERTMGAEVAAVEHRLRTPLTSIRAFSEILLRYPDDPVRREEFVRIIHDEAVRLSAAVDELVEDLDGRRGPVPVEPKEPKPKGGRTMAATTKNRGWAVVAAGTGINLALGILYTWSIFKGAIRASVESGGPFRWDLASINDPYAVCCLVFAFAMIVAGRVQDRFGPRLTALLGGLMVGAGFVWISQTANYWAWILGFGVLAGVGIGFGYSAATPPALKWFPPSRTGLVAGIVVSGFGLASVYIAPLAQVLLGAWGLQKAMLFFGVAFAVVVSALSLLLVNPPAGYLFGEAARRTDEKRKQAPSVRSRGDFRPGEMLRTPTFYILWTLYLIGSGAGLMVIGSVAGMAKASLGELAFVAVALLAVGNAAGRIVAGVLSDWIGRTKTLIGMFLFQAALMFAAVPVVGGATQSAALLVALATFIGFNYGTNLSLFPSFAKDFWGLKHFGTNYGILFTAWGVGGFVMGRVSQMLKASTGSYNLSFLVAGTLLIAGVGLALTLREGKRYQIERAVEEEAAQAATPEVRPGASTGTA